MSLHVTTGPEDASASAELVFKGVYMAGKPDNSRWDLCCQKGTITSLDEHVPVESELDSGVQFLCPSLCHPHIHLDKCFLLSHLKYADLEVEKGDFAEAMKLTSRFIFLHFSIPISYSRHRRSKVSI